MVNGNTYDFICPCCFSKGFRRDGICRNCGFDQNKEKQNGLRLPYFTHLGSRYLVGSLLGSGGFGITYKAWDMVENQLCAIKEYAPLGVTFRGGDGFTLNPVTKEQTESYLHGRERFVEEAQTLMKCSDISQIVNIQGCFKQHNTVYYAMEYLDGENLRNYTNGRGGRLDLKEAWNIIEKAGRGLERLHQEHRIFHRDISPENIMIVQKGEAVKLIDFGNARYLLDGQAKEGGLSVVLKPGYAPPEQYLRTGTQGAYTDVYALAGSFYTIVSGVKIVDSPSRMAGSVYRRLDQMGLGIPRDVSEAVDAALRLNYKERTQTVSGFLNQLSIAMQQGAGLAERGQPYLWARAENGFSKRYVIPPNQSIRIGRNASQCMIRINDSRISGLHLELCYASQEGRFYIRDFSLNGTFYRGQRVQKETIYQIMPGEEIILGVQVCKIRLEIEKNR